MIPNDYMLYASNIDASDDGKLIVFLSGNKKTRSQIMLGHGPIPSGFSGFMDLNKINSATYCGVKLVQAEKSNRKTFLFSKDKEYLIFLGDDMGAVRKIQASLCIDKRERYGLFRAMMFSN